MNFMMQEAVAKLDPKLNTGQTTAGRYPSNLALEIVGPAEAQEALQAAREIRDTVIARIS